MQKFLSQISLFQGLDQADLDFLQTGAATEDFAKGKLIFQSGDESRHLYLLQRGAVKLFNLKKGTGKEEIVCHIQPGGFFCLAPLLTRPVLHINAKTLEASQLVVIPKSTIQQLIKRSHLFAQRVIEHLACKECELCEEVCDLSLSSTKERLAKYLLSQYQQQRLQGSKSFRLTLNQSQLASFLGTVRETLSRDLAAFKKAKVIDSRQGKISILKPDELAFLSGGNSGGF
ncbi:MAG: Crp/Fnr family transcriptional regulator [bacterium]|nr:Crp/Fnr family transcriptional regulator [bacterium]